LNFEQLFFWGPKRRSIFQIKVFLKIVSYICRSTSKKMDQQNQAQQPSQLNIEISEEVAEGNYANLAIITHSHSEFVIDFVNVMPGTPKSKVKSRIILTPQHAKRLMKALTENIGRYESVNGSIKDIEEVQIPFNFGGPAAQA
jgi:type III secretory pathway component EscV